MANTTSTSSTTQIEKIYVNDTFDEWRNKLNNLITKVNSLASSSYSVGQNWFTIDGTVPLGGLEYNGSEYSANIGNYKDLWTWVKKQYNLKRIEILTDAEWTKELETYGSCPYYAYLGSYGLENGEINETKLQNDNSIDLMFRLPKINYYNFKQYEDDQIARESLTGHTGYPINVYNYTVGVYATLKQI